MSNVIRTNDTDHFPKLHKKGFFICANAFRFKKEDGSPPGSFIRIACNNGSLNMSYKRNAENTEDDYGNPVSSFASAFMCAGVGSFNGRETSYEYEMPLLEGVKREYDYPARDLEKVHEKVGLPAMAGQFPQFNISAKLESDFYGHSAAIDMYWHNLDRGLMSGYDGTLNAMHGSKTKSINVIYWIHAPSQINGRGGPANGWTGGEKLADINLSGKNLVVLGKRERASGNDFLQIALVGENQREIDVSISEVNNWVLTDLWRVINNSPAGKRLLAEMGDNAPKEPHGNLGFDCTAGSEVWYSKPDDSISSIIWRDFYFDINGQRYTPWADPQTVDQKVFMPDQQQSENSDSQSDGDKPPKLALKKVKVFVGEKEIVTSSPTAQITHLGNDNGCCCEASRDPLKIEGLRKGKTIITVKDGHKESKYSVIVS